MRTRIYVEGGICKALLKVVNIAHICVSVVTSITQQIDHPSHLQKSEQASCADEQVHMCEEHDLSLLQLQLINKFI